MIRAFRRGRGSRGRGAGRNVSPGGRIRLGSQAKLLAGPRRREPTTEFGDSPGGLRQSRRSQKRFGPRDAVDRLQDARDDLVRVAFGVRAAIFQIARVTVLDEVNRHSYGSATI